MKTEAKFLFSNGSAFPVRVLCGDLGIVLLELSNFLHLQIQILGEKKEKSGHLNKVMKEFLLYLPPPLKKTFCLGIHLLGKRVIYEGQAANFCSFLLLNEITFLKMQHAQKYYW